MLDVLSARNRDTAILIWVWGVERGDAFEGHAFQICWRYSKLAGHCQQHIGSAGAALIVAELFKDKFGGEITDPKDRPRWPPVIG